MTNTSEDHFLFEEIAEEFETVKGAPIVEPVAGARVTQVAVRGADPQRSSRTRQGQAHGGNRPAAPKAARQRLSICRLNENRLSGEKVYGTVDHHNRAAVHVQRWGVLCIPVLSERLPLPCGLHLDFGGIHFPYTFHRNRILQFR